MKDFGYGRMVAVVVITLFAIYMLKKSGEIDPTKELERFAQSIAKDFPQSEQSPDPARPGESALKQLQRLLSDGSEVDLRFAQVDELAAVLEDGGLEQLIEEVRPLGVYGYAGWVRCAVFAEWGRRDFQGALAYLENPPAMTVPYQFPYHKWEERQAYYSVFRGWAEDSPYVAIGALRTSNHPGTHWKWFAYREAARQLATQQGLRAWSLLPRGPERGGALLGMFEGLAKAEVRLEAIDRWLPELEAPGNRGFDLGGEKSFSEARPSKLKRLEFLTEVGAVLADADLPLARAWLSQRAVEQGVDSALYVDPVLVRWAALHPARARTALEGGEAEREMLIRGILRGRPQFTPELLPLIEPARQVEFLKEVLAVAHGSALRHYFPTPHRANLRLQDRHVHQVMAKAIEAANLANPETIALFQDLHHKFRHLQK